MKYKRLSATAIAPRKAHAADAGYDLTADWNRYDREHDYWEYGTGIAIEVPKGYVGLVFPRSSISKKHMILANGVGVIDSGYTGEIKLRFRVDGHDIYNVGDRIGQLLIMPLANLPMEETADLATSDRGDSGFGSSGE